MDGQVAFEYALYLHNSRVQSAGRNMQPWASLRLNEAGT